MKAKYLTVLNDNFQTEFMRACDMFEPFKAAVVIQTIEVTFKAKCNLQEGERILKQIVEHSQNSKHFAPIFIHMLYMESEDVILKNNSLKVPYFRDENIKVISNGDKWSLLDDFIKNALNQ
jgi:hypothetical protein